MTKEVCTMTEIRSTDDEVINALSSQIKSQKSEVVLHGISCSSQSSLHFD
jgi:hypothetical protein